MRTRLATGDSKGYVMPDTWQSVPASMSCALPSSCPKRKENQSLLMSASISPRISPIQAAGGAGGNHAVQCRCLPLLCAAIPHAIATNLNCLEITYIQVLLALIKHLLYAHQGGGQAGRGPLLPLTTRPLLCHGCQFWTAIAGLGHCSCCSWCPQAVTDVCTGSHCPSRQSAQSPGEASEW